MDRIKLVSPNSFREAALKDSASALGVLKAFAGVVKKVDEEKRIITFAISSENPDREGDIIRIAGWDLKNYRRNPVVLWAHGHHWPPVARSLKVYKETVGDTKLLLSDAEFPEKDLHEFGFMVFRLYVAKFLNATSVGFIPRAYEYRRDAENEQRIIGVEFTKQELLEYSAVPVPANPDALVQARSIGIDIAPMKAWAEQVLDETGAKNFTLMMPRTHVERALKIVNNERTVVPVKNGKVDRETQRRLLKENLERLSQNSEAIAEAAKEFGDALNEDETFPIVPEDAEVEIELSAAADADNEEEVDTTDKTEEGADGAGEESTADAGGGTDSVESDAGAADDMSDAEDTTDAAAGADADEGAAEAEADAAAQQASGSESDTEVDGAAETDDTPLDDDTEVTDEDIAALVQALGGEVPNAEDGDKEFDERVKKALEEAGITEEQFRSMLSAAFMEEFNKARGRLS